MLGEIDDEGQLKETMYAIGPVTYMGDNTIHGNNHANYVDCKGFYNIVRYLKDFKEAFPDLYNVGVGQLWPHIKTEMYCESLFSQAGFLSEPRQERTGIHMYEI